MRKAAATAFVEADASAALRRAISTGPRPMQEYDIGEMVYFYRMGADKQKKFAPRLLARTCQDRDGRPTEHIMVVFPRLLSQGGT